MAFPHPAASELFPLVRASADLALFPAPDSMADTTGTEYFGKSFYSHDNDIRTLRTLEGRSLQ
jgi:hypothetical protein